MLSTLVIVWMATVCPVQAHEVLPSIADVEVKDDTLVMDIRVNLEGFISGIDQTAFSDTNNAPQAADYDVLRALSPAELEDRFREFWPNMARDIRVLFDDAPATLTLDAVKVEETADQELPRRSDITISARVPAGVQALSLGWAPKFGALVVRQQGVDAPYDGYLEAGADTGPIALSGGDQASGWKTFFDYIPVGFDHIVPKGLDHILFVLGLFFLSTRMSALLWQISAFTLAHTITLALAALGYVNIPGSIVEPLIALSIVYVAVENLYTDGLSPWRPFVIFGFGLLHGLGFASVLAEFGLPAGSFIPALIGFNIGVEVGQLAVVAVAYLCVVKAIENARNGDADKLLSGIYLIGMLAVIACLIPLSGLASYPDLVPLVAAVAILLGLCAVTSSVPRFEGYREIVAMPGSILIAVVAAYWCVERVFL